jgi:hypothetical protein
MESTNQLSPVQQLDDDQIDLLPYLRKLGERWRLIALWVGLTVLATALFDVFLADRTYRAEAVIRPIASAAVEGRIEGFQGGLGGAAGGLGGLAAALGGGSNDADEYTAIMLGFEFNTALAEHHKLPAGLSETSWLEALVNYGSPLNPKWETYRNLQSLFECSYAHDTGNMTLYFIASSPAEAQQILTYYINDLRDLLRAREISTVSVAIDSLRAEALSTADPILRSELYNLEAKQLERRKMAQVEADFAFRVLDAPAASDKKYRPLTLLDCLVTGLAAALGAALFVLFRYRPSQEENRPNVFLGPVGVTSRRVDAAGGSS